MSGMVKVYVDHQNGRRSILDFMSDGDWIGELSIFSYEADIKPNKIIQQVTCLEFDIALLRRYCQNNADASFYFAAYTSNKLLKRSYRMSEYMNYPLEKRLATFIVTYQQDGLFSVPHTEVSEYLNVSYRHVLYVIKQFCHSGLLVKEKGYRIADMEKLRSMSHHVE